MFVVTCFGDDSGGHAPSEVVELSGTNPPTIQAIVWVPFSGVNRKAFPGPRAVLSDSGLGAGVPSPPVPGAAENEA